MRLVYFGSPEVAIAPLEALHGAGHDIRLVVSGSDKRRGRGSRTSPTPVKAAALRLGLRVTDDMAEVLDTDAELGVVVAYGRLIPNEILDRIPLVNIHFSLLPRWRGAAPVERAILAGDESTGVSLMQVVPELDAGGVFRSVETSIGPSDTAPELTARLGGLGAELVVDALAEGLGTPTPQPIEGVSYAHKIVATDRELLPSLTPVDFLRRVRIGGAWMIFRDRRVKVLDATIADTAVEAGDFVGPTTTGTGRFIGPTEIALDGGVVELVTVQPEGKSAMPAGEWARGARPVGGSIGP